MCSSFSLFYDLPAHASMGNLVLGFSASSTPTTNKVSKIQTSRVWFWGFDPLSYTLRIIYGLHVTILILCFFVCCVTGIAFAILGTILFMPGFYYTRIAYYAYKGYKGFSFSNIPAVWKEFEDFSSLRSVPVAVLHSCTFGSDGGRNDPQQQHKSVQ